MHPIQQVYKFHYIATSFIDAIMKLKVLVLLISYTCFAQVPAYYSNIDFTESGESIKTQLTTLITNTHTTELVYTSGSSGFLDTWTVLKQSDLDPANSSNVLLIYGWDDSATNVSEHRTRDKNESCHTSSCTGKWVREHTFPKSLATPDLGTEGAGADAHNLRAVDAQRNNSRSNKLFGAASSSSASYSINSSSWYPGDEWIGDVARIIMYMQVRYPTQCAAINAATGGSTFAPLLDMPDLLLQWNAQDPPSNFEINRNNSIASYQGNRNPFIDNPYLATMIWSDPVASDTWQVLDNDKHDRIQLTLYPTITESMIYIQNASDWDAKFYIYNTAGQQLQSGTLEEKQIDMSKYASGLFFISVLQGNSNKTFKIVKK